MWYLGAILFFIASLYFTIIGDSFMWGVTIIIGWIMFAIGKIDDNKE